MTERRLGDYDVGYCKTPAGSRWRKGISGNPSGKSNPHSKRNRKKGKSKPRSAPLGVAEALQEELNRMLLWRENGLETEIPAYHLLAKKLIRDALKGSPSESRMALQYIEKLRVFEMHAAGLAEARAEEENGPYYTQEDRLLLKIAREGFDPDAPGPT